MPRAIASDGSWGLVHFTNGQTAGIGFAGFNGTKSVYWLDPTNGTLTAASPSSHANSGSQSYTPSGNNAAGQNDMVLVIGPN